MHKKKGDTLIEVALAIGIFSMVAIVVVSVISASTTGAQSSLELTITREEMDAQAEALRFIHDSYVVGSQSADASKNPYKEAWNALKGYARDPGANNANTAYNPTDCSSLYSLSGGNYILTNHSNSFIINTRHLGDFNTPSYNINNIVVEAPSSYSATPAFAPAATYPRIMYNAADTLYGQTELTTNDIKRVEGLFIVAFEGEKVQFVHDGGAVNPKAAFYDFYIRACWMPPSATRASTISTVVRLYDPDVVF